MSYCIMTIIYGVPLREEAYHLMQELGNQGDEDVSDDPSANGFKELYSASAPWKPGYCGIKLAEFTECTDAIPLDGLVLQATDEQAFRAKKMVETLDPRIRELCGPIGLYIIPSSS